MTPQPNPITRIHAPPRILIAAFPARGHMNPALALADNLVHLGCHVTFLSTVLSLRQSGRSSAAAGDGGGITYVTFSDYYNDEGFPKNWSWEDFELYNAELRRVGSETLRALVRSGIEDGVRFGCLVYTLIMPWVADVAAEFEAPAAVLWVQSAAVFLVLHRYFHGFREKIEEVFSSDDSSSCGVLRFPGLDRIGFSAEDLPTMLKPGDPSLIEHFREQFEAIDRDERRARVLVNTFDELEYEALAMSELSLVAVGPLVNGCDDNENDVMIEKWLDEKPRGSVVFVCFGSVVKVSKAQRDEIAGALMGLQRPFLWVIREREEGEKEDELTDQHQGMIVPWCRQVAVLCHVAISCFVSHCGWNSTLESLACGVPVVAVPQSVDQTTNAKLVESVWKTGLRARSKSSGGDLVDGEEIKRCLEAVIGDEEFKRNAVKLRDLCREATAEGGPKAKNLSAFLADLSMD